MTPRDPMGRRALFDPPPAPGGAPAEGAGRGRRAFFSEPATDVTPAAEATAVVRLTCRACRNETDLAPGDAARLLLGSLWWPLGAWNHRLRCPACHRVSWCRMGWDGLFDWR